MRRWIGRDWTTEALLFYAKERDLGSFLYDEMSMTGLNQHVQVSVTERHLRA